MNSLTLKVIQFLTYELSLFSAAHGISSVKSWLTSLDMNHCNRTDIIPLNGHSPMSLAIASQLCLTQSPHCDGLYRDPVIDLYVSVDVFGTMECYSNFDSGFLQSYADQAKPMLWLKKSLVQPQGEEYFIALPEYGQAYGLTNLEAPTIGIPTKDDLDACVPYQNGILGCNFNSGNCHFLDLRLKTWTPFASFSPDSHVHGRMATVNGHPVVMGGYKTPLKNQLNDQVEVYDPKLQIWKDAPKMIKRRRVFTVHNLDYKTLIVIGGYAVEPNDLTDHVESWTYGTPSWIALQSLPQAISTHQSVVTIWPDGRFGILVLGGRGVANPSVFQKWAFFLDFESMTWEIAPSQFLPTAMGFGQLHSIGHKLYSIPFFQPSNDASTVQGTMVLTKDMSVFNSTWEEYTMSVTTGTLNIFILRAQRTIVVHN